MGLEHVVAAVMVVALMAYTTSGGADFGGGVWDLLATEPRRREQRLLISRAIAPIWEANHVWLILVVVLLLVCFPIAYAALSTALHIPLTVMLVGIVLRGSAFVFRSYDPRRPDESTGGWRVVFAVTSAITPLMLGVVLGAVAGGRIQIDPSTGQVRTDFVSEWLAPFPLMIGLFTLSTCALLAAVYLTLETDEPDLQEDFRRRALAAAVAVGAMAWISLAVARLDAPLLFEALTGPGWALTYHPVTAAVAIGVIVAVYGRRYRLARLLAIVQVTLLIGGYVAASFPYLVPPSLSLSAAAAPSAVLRPVLIALGVGAVFLLPALLWLYAVFKRRPLPPVEAADEAGAAVSSPPCQQSQGRSGT